MLRATQALAKHLRVRFGSVAPFPAFHRSPRSSDTSLLLRLQPGIPAAAATMSSLAGMEKVAMSRFEPDEYINDRYAAMEQRLQVRRASAGANPADPRSPLPANSRHQMAAGSHSSSGQPVQLAPGTSHCLDHCYMPCRSAAAQSKIQPHCSAKRLLQRSGPVWPCRPA